MAAEDLYNSILQPPIGPDALGLPPAPPAPQMPVSPQGDDRKRKLLQLIAGALAAGLGPGKGTGLLQGVNQVQQRQDVERQRQDAINRQLYQQQQTDWEQQQRMYQQEAHVRGQALQNTLGALREKVAKGEIQTPEQYDDYVRTFTTGLQARGLRINEEFFRKNARFVYPGSEQVLYSAIDKALSNPLSKGTPIRADDTFMYTPPGAKAPVKITFGEAVPLANYPGVFREGQLLVTGDKPTKPQDAMSEAAEYERQLAILVQAGHDPKSVETQSLAADNAAKAINRRKPVSERAPARDRFSVQPVTNADGTTSIVRVNLETGQADPIALPAGVAGAGRPNEGAGKTAQYLPRTIEADKNARQFEARLANLGAQMDAQLPTILRSTEGQLYRQAQDEFINAGVRDESGAAIQPQEYERYRKIYFVEVGDSPQVIAQKRVARERVIAGLKLRAGNLAVQTPTTPSTPAGREEWERDPVTGKMRRKGK